MAAEVQPAKMLGTAQESDDLWIVQVPVRRPDVPKLCGLLPKRSGRFGDAVSLLL